MTAGNIQIPLDGQPNVLFREQTIGGYSIIATVLSCYLWRLAHAQPGAEVCFQQVSLEEGQKTAREWQAFMDAAQTLIKKQ